MMAMIIGNVYPDAETYYGEAYVEHMVFGSPRTGLEPMDFIAQTMISTAENAISLKKGVILESYVWATPKTTHGIPYYEWTIDVYYFRPELLEPITVSISVLILAALVVVGIWFVFSGVTTILYGRPPTIDPNTGLPVKDPNVTIAEVLNKAMTYAGPLLLGYGALMLYQTYQKTKLGGGTYGIP